MTTLFFAMTGYEALAASLSHQCNAKRGEAVFRHFPDGEFYVQICSPVKDKNVVLVCGLDHPDSKVMALMFFAQTAKELGAKSVGLITPYLGYMRQDKRFKPGEVVTSNIFASFLSQQVDWLTTIDPHLHRHKTMDEIYTIPTTVLHAAEPIAKWIQHHVKTPLLIGPDEESAQWVEEVARLAGVPFTVLKKTRKGDKDVDVSLPDVEHYQNCCPVLVDDIISTARTMIETVKHLRSLKMEPPVCIGVHAIFAGDAYEALKASGVEKIVTCNTISHPSNAIDISPLIASHIET